MLLKEKEEDKMHEKQLFKMDLIEKQKKENEEFYFTFCRLHNFQLQYPIAIKQQRSIF